MVTKQKNIPWVICKLARCVQPVYWARVASTFDYDDKDDDAKYYEEEEEEKAHMMTKQKNIPWVICKLARCVKPVYWARVATTFRCHEYDTTYDKIR